MLVAHTSCFKINRLKINWVILTNVIYFWHVNRRVIPRGGTRMTNEPEKWSSLEEIAEHLGVSKDTIRNWIKKGRHSAPSCRQAV